MKNILRKKTSFPSPALPVFVLDDCWQECQRAMVDESGVFPCRYYSAMVLHTHIPITWGMKNRPTDGRFSEA
jgi:hypothetical protein